MSTQRPHTTLHVGDLLVSDNGLWFSKVLAVCDENYLMSNPATSLHGVELQRPGGWQNMFTLHEGGWEFVAPEPLPPPKRVLYNTDQSLPAIQEYVKAMKEGLAAEKTKGWRLCRECGEKEYPHVNKAHWGTITVSTGTCPVCKKKDATLIPRSDYEGHGD